MERSRGEWRKGPIGHRKRAGDHGRGGGRQCMVKHGGGTAQSEGKREEGSGWTSGSPASQIRGRRGEERMVGGAAVLGAVAGGGEGTGRRGRFAASLLDSSGRGGEGDTAVTEVCSTWLGNGRNDGTVRRPERRTGARIG